METWLGYQASLHPEIRPVMGGGSGSGRRLSRRSQRVSEFRHACQIGHARLYSEDFHCHVGRGQNHPDEDVQFEVLLASSVSGGDGDPFRTVAVNAAQNSKISAIGFSLEL